MNQLLAEGRSERIGVPFLFLTCPLTSVLEFPICLIQRTGTRLQ